MRSGVIASTRRFFVDLYVIFKNRVLTDSGTFIENPIEFNNEKLLLTPNAYKENKIYSALPLDGSGDFTFSRNSSATYIEDGIIKSALPNVPRIQDGKILIEGQATNLIEYSSTTQGKIPLGGTSRISFTNEIMMNPAGNSNVMKVTRVIEETYHRGVRMTLSNIQSNTEYTFSAYMRAENGSVGVNLDLSDQPPSHHKVLTNEWQKVSFTQISRDGSGSQFLDVVFSSNGNIGETFFIWGVQLEEGNKVTSYIPTNGTAATRLADIATVTPPTGVTEIIETIDGVEQSPITTIPPTYQLPDGEINKVIMQ